MEQFDDLKKLLIEADQLFSNEKDYWKAKIKYEELLAINPKDPYAKKQLEACNKQIDATPTHSNGTISSTNIIPNTKIPIEWVDIPAGTFMMGSPAREVEKLGDDLLHKVSLNGYKMSKYQITFDQYDAFCDATEQKRPTNSRFGRGKRPIISITWKGAVAFTKWLGGGSRLPTEAEWEYACRAGTTTPFNTGNNITTSQANYNGNYPYNNNTRGIFRNETLPVGSFPPNAWGLYDMHGNVTEWCHDWYDTFYYEISPSHNPQGPESGTYRVHRGGDWQNSGGFCRSARRIYSAPTLVVDIGFRIVAPK